MYKVFLIEDEIVIREALERMIPWNEYGFELVGKAKDGEIALPMIRKTKPDVLITDIKMPFMDGLTLSGIVKKEIPEIRIVIVSGYDDFEYARKAIALGVDDYLLKPAIMSRRNLTMAGLYASAAFLMAAKSIMYLRKKFINFSVKNG